MLLTSMWWPEPINHSTWGCKTRCADRLYVLHEQLHKQSRYEVWPFFVLGSYRPNRSAVSRSHTIARTHARTPTHIYTASRNPTNDRLVEEAATDTTRKDGHPHIFGGIWTRDASNPTLKYVSEFASEMLVNSCSQRQNYMLTIAHRSTCS